MQAMIRSDKPQAGKNTDVNSEDPFQALHPDYRGAASGQRWRPQIIPRAILSRSGSRCCSEWHWVISIQAIPSDNVKFTPSRYLVCDHFAAAGFDVALAFRVPRSFPFFLVTFLFDPDFGSTPRLVRSIPITLMSSTPGNCGASIIQ